MNKAAKERKQENMCDYLLRISRDTQAVATVQGKDEQGNARFTIIVYQPEDVHGADEQNTQTVLAAVAAAVAEYDAGQLSGKTIGELVEEYRKGV